MAGRGCTILVKVLASDRSEDLTLPVALHSPLEVLRDQLVTLTNIQINDQVLILCDLSDPERNNDVVLERQNDNLSLRECGLQHGSVLTLHALGLSAEQRTVVLKSDLKHKMNALEAERPTLTLTTRISPARADHSYNGVIFDIETRGPYEVDVVSISVGGMLGRVV